MVGARLTPQRQCTRTPVPSFRAREIKSTAAGKTSSLLVASKLCYGVIKANWAKTAISAAAEAGPAGPEAAAAEGVAAAASKVGLSAIKSYQQKEKQQVETAAAYAAGAAVATAISIAAGTASSL